MAGLAAAFGVTLLLVGVLIHAVVRDLTASYTGIGLNPFSPSGGSASESTPLAPGVSSPTAPLPEVTPAPWNGRTRVTILLMGLDYRDWQAGSGAPRTDSMMLISVDPITDRVSMLSIPRDLWVEIPGFQHNRINTAYSSGEGNRLPGGGPGLAMRTVESVIGVPIQYYVVLDFSTFERMIDEIGGVDVLVEERIKISPIGRTSFWLDPKAHHLDGPEALAYARTRRGGGGDFSRAGRQQQVAMAILDRVTGFQMIPFLVAKAPLLYQQLASGVRTNLSLDEMIGLAWLVAGIPRENYQTAVIQPPNMVGFYTRPDGAQVLRAVPDAIRELRDLLFVDTSAIGP